MKKRNRTIAIALFALVLLVLATGCYFAFGEGIVEHVAAPVFMDYGTYASDHSYHVVGIRCSTGGAAILYSIDGSTEKNYSENLSTYKTLDSVSHDAILVPVGSTIRARGVLEGREDSSTATLRVVNPTVATPVLTDYGVVFNNDSYYHLIEIRCATAGATIRYTTDGSTPTSSSSTYSPSSWTVEGIKHSGILVPAGTTVKAYAHAIGYNDSSTASHVVKKATVASPVITDFGISFDDTSKHVIGISCSTAGAAIRYTTDGSTPSSLSANYTATSLRTIDGAYHEGMLVPVGSTVKAIGIKGGYSDSTTTSFSVPFNGAVSNPQIVNYGVYADDTSYQVIGISCTTQGAVVRYTTDGSTPTGSSDPYSPSIYQTTLGASCTGILVPGGTTIKAIGLGPGFDDSSVTALSVEDPDYILYAMPGYYSWTSASSPSASFVGYGSTNQGVQDSLSVMKVVLDRDFDAFSLYIRSSSESGYDYVIVSKVNAESIPTSSTHASAHRSAIVANTGTTLSSYNLVSFSDLKSGDYFYVVFMKNASDFDPVNDDRGYVLLPK